MPTSWGDEDLIASWLDAEGDAELYDPKLAMEATTTDLRNMWADWRCQKGSGNFTSPQFFGRGIGGVPTPAVDAYRALEQALTSSGYQPGPKTGAYNCRKIGGSDKDSLHSYGIAIDIDWDDNPFSTGDPYSGKIKENHVEAVLSIKNKQGQSVWSWGGNWKKRDRMHFQLDQGPSDVDVDWSTVPGGEGMTSVVAEPTATKNTGNASAEMIEAAFAAGWAQGDKDYWLGLSADSAEWSDFWNACYGAAEKVTRSGKPGDAWIEAAFAAGWAQGDKTYWLQMSADSAEWSDFWEAFTVAVG